MIQKTLKYISILAMVIPAMFSCSYQGSEMPHTVGPAKDTNHIYRVKVLENRTITWCRLRDEEKVVLRPLDTVWLNLDTHRVDDTSRYTMLAVILLNK